MLCAVSLGTRSYMVAAMEGHSRSIKYLGIGIIVTTWRVPLGF